MQEVLIADELSVIPQEGQLVNYLRVRPLVLSNTLSQIWDRLNLPDCLSLVGGQKDTLKLHKLHIYQIISYLARSDSLQDINLPCHKL